MCRGVRATEVESTEKKTRERLGNSLPSLLNTSGGGAEAGAGPEAGAGSGRGGLLPGLSPPLFLRAPPTRISPRSRKAQRLGETRESGWWKWRLVLAVSSSLWFSEEGGFDGEAAAAQEWTGESWDCEGLRTEPFREDERKGDAKQL